MINLYDLFESFGAVLDLQKEHSCENVTMSTDRSILQGEQKASADEVVSMDNEEEWQIEVQARFMRALHELDYMGFIKHTGRKADHIVRTIYDIAD